MDGVIPQDDVHPHETIFIYLRTFKSRMTCFQIMPSWLEELHPDRIRGADGRHLSHPEMRMKYIQYHPGSVVVFIGWPHQLREALARRSSSPAMAKAGGQARHALRPRRSVCVAFRLLACPVPVFPHAGTRPNWRASLLHRCLPTVSAPPLTHFCIHVTLLFFLPWNLPFPSLSKFAPLPTSDSHMPASRDRR